MKNCSAVTVHNGVLKGHYCCGKTLSILGGEKDVEEGRIRRRAAFSLLLASPVLSVAFSGYAKSKSMNPYDERRLLQQNKKIQEANRAPEDFPNFIREGEQSIPGCILQVMGHKLCYIVHDLIGCNYVFFRRIGCNSRKN